MSLKTLIHGKRFRARAHANLNDINCVPLDSIQTDDPEEFLAFRRHALTVGQTVWFKVRDEEDREALSKELDGQVAD